jgi:hypothetical protein
MNQAKGIVMTEVDVTYLSQMERDSHLLECLHAYGVDEWDNFKAAYQMFEDERGEE